MAALRALSREQKASLFMTLLAAFKVLLSRLAGQDDIVVGSPIAGRRLRDTEGLIGFFLNTLVLRTDLGGNPSFRELLDRVRETTLGAYDHQDVPFEALLAELKPERDLSRTPLFQVFFNMLNLPPEKSRVQELEIDRGPAAEMESKFDLTLYVTEAMGAIYGNLVYNADLFDAPRMEELVRQYRAVLEWAARHPDAWIQGVSLLTPKAAAVLPDPTQPLGAEWRGAVHELFLEAARRHPERPAVIDPEGSLDLRRAGRRRRPPRRPPAGGRGGAGGPGGDLGPPQRSRRLGGPGHAGRGRRLRDARSGLSGGAPGRDPAPRRAAGLDGAGRRRGAAARDRGAARRLGGGGAAASAASCCRRRSEAAAGLLAALPAAGEPVATGPDDLAFVAFTSGSTGAPKGILGRHGPLSHFLPWQRERFGLSGATATACSPGWRTTRCSATSSPRSAPAPRSALPTRRRSSSPAGWRPGRRGRGSPSPTSPRRWGRC